MNYDDDYFRLKKAFQSEEAKVEIDDFVIHKYEFFSTAHNILPGNKTYHCETHNLDFEESNVFNNDIGHVENNVDIKDIFVEENIKYPYRILTHKDASSIAKITFFLHGFNEKYWDKYLPWGKAICESTRSAVVFFPIAFHMQRAPLSWSAKREMYALSELRKKKFPNIINSTLSNVAISMRLHSMPQRFILSGLQSYYDMIGFIEQCKNGKHELIDKDFSFNIFAYSIGGMLAEILKLSNHNNYFDKSKVCMFCSGAVFNRLTPVSKFILDSEANVALYSYLVEHFDSFLKKSSLLRHYMTEHFEGKVFHSMLDYNKMREFREDLFKKAENDFYAITLKRDSVIPSFEVVNTLKGAARNIGIEVEETDFDYNYTHENPFPPNHSKPELVEQSFNTVFDKVSRFLAG